jgi:hypothetical protein
MLIMKQVTSPTLDGSGQFTQEFGEIDKIKSAIVAFMNPFISSYLFGCSCSYTGNLLTVTVEKQNMGGVGAWVVAITANLANKAVAMLVEGE